MGSSGKRVLSGLMHGWNLEFGERLIPIALPH